MICIDCKVDATTAVGECQYGHKEAQEGSHKEAQNAQKCSGVLPDLWWAKNNQLGNPVAPR